ncbi:HTH gntR-type domain-containing protein [Bordetella sputigena]|uniref:GntR family transcriptional regulator n=1 Tax=Bordetella sputigena TaxID=1416810 RepID=UPI0039F0AA59
MALEAIKKQSAEYLVTEALRAQMLSGEILPGTRITEASLAERLAVSRGTLRIALYQLAQEGLVKQTPYTGWATSSIEPEDLWELYTLRAGLESTAARIVCERMNPATAKAIEEAFAALEQACALGKYPHIAKKDFLFHRKIIDLTGSGRLSEHYRLVEQQIKVFVASTYNFVAKPEDVIDHHQPFVQALISGDADAASHLLWVHAVEEGKRLHSYLLSIRGETAWGIPQAK